MKPQTNFIKYCFGTAKLEDISTCEKEMEVSFPDTFKRKNLACDGGTPTRDIFNYYSNALKRYTGSCLGSFLVFSEDYPCRSDLLIEAYRTQPEFFPKGLIAFAEVGNGDQICFDYRQGKDNLDPPIVIWEHEGDEGKDVSFLAPNFESFMNMLMDEEEAEKDFERLINNQKNNS